VVHAVLERLYDLPAAERTLEAAARCCARSGSGCCEAEPGRRDAVRRRGRPVGLAGQRARAARAGYFALEDPTRLEPAERERLVEVVLPGGLRLRGIVDRLDRAPSGDVRVVDYKTGRAPREAFEGKALFQMKFYALVLWRTTGVVPRLLQLMYLGDREVLRYSPDEADLLATERKLLALWEAIERATQLRDFPPAASRLCDWCDHQALCPSFGGTPPPFPEVVPGPGRAAAAPAGRGAGAAGAAGDPTG
jgi:putative RecB family exonuclease